MANDVDNIRVRLDVSVKESALLKKLRAHPFSKITVVMNEGQPIRVTIEASEMLTVQDGMDYAAKAGEKIYSTPNNLVDEAVKT